MISKIFPLLLLTALLPLCGHAAVLTKTPEHPVKIMCVGDSITEGKFLTTGGYRKILQDLLKKGGYSFTYVGKEDNGQPANKTGFSEGMENPNHEGYGSFRIDEFITGGSEEGHTSPAIGKTIASNKPDVILMMVGTNDVIQHKDLPNISKRLKQLVTAIYSANSHVTLVLAQITPMGRGDADANVVAYNAQIASLVEKEKSIHPSIILVDMHSALDPSHDLGDGVHPTASGFQKMAAVWYEDLTGEKPSDMSAPAAAAPAPAPTPEPPAPAADSTPAPTAPETPAAPPATP